MDGYYRKLKAGLAARRSSRHELDPSGQFDSLSWVWKFLHVQSVVGDKTGWHFGVEYPLVPWLGVMALGYALCVYLARSELDRARLFARAGLALVLAFAVLRAFDIYGDLHAWSIEDTSTKTVISFMNVTKYPPSQSLHTRGAIAKGGRGP
jgi:uncharacterized membrane protein